MRPNDIKAELSALGWSQAAFAERLRVHPNTVSKWIAGKAEMPGPAIAYLMLAVKVVRMGRDV